MVIVHKGQIVSGMIKNNLGNIVLIRHSIYLRYLSMVYLFMIHFT